MFLCFISWPQIHFVLVGGVTVEVLGVTGCFSCRNVPCGGLLYSPGGLQGCIPHALFSFAVVNLLHLRISPLALSLMHILWESLWLKASCGWGLNFLSDLPRIALKCGGIMDLLILVFALLFCRSVWEEIGGGELVEEGKIKRSSGNKWCLSGFCFIAESIILSNQLVVEQASN